MNSLQPLSLLLALLYVAIGSNCQSNEAHDEDMNDSVVNEPEGICGDVDRLEKMAEFYEPSTVDLSVDMEKYLPDSDLAIVNAMEDSVINRIVNLILLKQYLFQLQNANQGYNLLTMRKGKARVLIDRFVENNGIDVNAEFLNSGAPYILVSKNSATSRDIHINKLIDQIKSEQARILKGH